jgi:AraC-like DNA-binding protein
MARPKRFIHNRGAAERPLDDAGAGSAVKATLLAHGPEGEPHPGSLRSDEIFSDSHWHYHDVHQIICPFEGSIELEVEGGRHLIPRHLAAWIPAGVAHRVSIRRVRSISVFLPEGLVADDERRVRAVLVSPLMNAMLIEATRWPVQEKGVTHTSQAFFGAFAALCAEWIENEADLFIPTTDNAQLKRAMDSTAARMDENLPQICRAAGMSERSLRRRLKQEIGLTWEAFRRRTRILKAVSLLTETDLSISELAATCGFQCPSAFARAFKATMRQTPRAYRKRARRQ